MSWPTDTNGQPDAGTPVPGREPGGVVREAGFVLGIDLGGTKCAAALVDSEGTTGVVRTVPTPAAEGPDAVLDAVVVLIGEVLAEVGLHAPDGLGSTGSSDVAPIAGTALTPDGVTVRAVGVGTAGVVDVGTGTIVSATDAFAGWVGTEVAAGLRRRLEPILGPVPVHVQNDVDAHAAGEAWLGAAAGADPVLMVAVGTGVGGAVVIGGQPLRGAHHLAGEMGHMPAPGAEGLRCSCGRPGHLEAIASGPAMHRRYLALGGDPDSLDARDVVARAESGDHLALTAVRDAATALGRAIAGVATVLDPAVVVIGGGMAGAGPLWWHPMERTVRAEVVEPLAELPLRPAALGQRSAIVGAARAAWRLLGTNHKENTTRCTQ